jgi:hypothetical protein
METWMVLELMDRGTLAQLVRGGAFVVPTSRQIKLVRRVTGVREGGRKGRRKGGRGTRVHVEALSDYLMYHRLFEEHVPLLWLVDACI